MTNKQRYEAFFQIVKEAEFVWNVEPEDLDVIAEVLRARAELKRQVRSAAKEIVERNIDSHDSEVPDVA